MKLLVIIKKKYSIHEVVFFFVLDFLSKAPAKLSNDDLEDFCSLANHYASNTPQSFRKVEN
jgi:hypothetical protein